MQYNTQSLYIAIHKKSVRIIFVACVTCLFLHNSVLSCPFSKIILQIQQFLYKFIHNSIQISVHIPQRRRAAQKRPFLFPAWTDPAKNKFPRSYGPIRLGKARREGIFPHARRACGKKYLPNNLSKTIFAEQYLPNNILRTIFTKHFPTNPSQAKSRKNFAMRLSLR